MKLSVIGFGVMGERIVRASLEHPSPEVNLVAVWDPSTNAMTRLAKDIPSAPSAASLEEAIALADCVYIASPPKTHLSLAREALAAGKAVFTEKPLGVSLSDSQKFVAETSGNRVAVNFIFASSPAVAQLRRWIDEGVVGEPTSLKIETDFATWPRGWQMDAVTWLARREEGGFTREVVSHFLFLTSRLLGETTLEQAKASFEIDGLSETSIQAKLRVGDLPVTLTGGVGTTKKEDHNLWLLEGTKGAVRLIDWSTAERHDPNGGWITAPDALPHSEARPLILRDQLTKLAAMTAGHSHDLASPLEAFAVQKIVEDILASSV
ncbi:MAG: Gfo/Idh/MocA family oxidoreductase [Rhodospirillales bacterium]